MNRDDVIKGLECCQLDVNKCLDCPYLDKQHEAAECGIELHRDAIALLKAQEPRVLTLDEVIASKPGTVVWLEDFDKPDVISGLLKRLFIYTKTVDFLIVKKEVNNEVTADLDVYGSEWRCWTSRPDEATREATPWPN